MKLMHERDLQKREKTYLPLCLINLDTKKLLYFETIKNR
jgi:hypothetical protein